MFFSRSVGSRALALLLAVTTLVVAVPVVVHHHADHPGEASHLERHHGGHGGLLEQDEARIPTFDGPQALPARAIELPAPSAAPRSRPTADDLVSPPGRAPPQVLPRAPPLSS